MMIGISLISLLTAAVTTTVIQRGEKISREEDRANLKRTAQTLLTAIDDRLGRLESQSRPRYRPRGLRGTRRAAGFAPSGIDAAAISTAAASMSGRLQWLFAGVKNGYELKLTFAVPQPTCWIQMFWRPSMSGARSWSATITCAFLKDASFPSPAR
jgi:hypothetical protein